MWISWFETWFLFIWQWLQTASRNKFYARMVYHLKWIFQFYHLVTCYMLLLKSAANRERNSWDIKPISQICPIQDPGDKWSNMVFLKVDQSIDRLVTISQWCQTSDEILLFNNWAISSDNGTFNPPYITFFLTLYKVTCHEYGRCSKISNTSCLLERPRQTVQTQIGKEFVNCNPI